MKIELTADVAEKLAAITPSITTQEQVVSQLIYKEYERLKETVSFDQDFIEWRKQKKLEPQLKSKS